MNYRLLTAAALAAALALPVAANAQTADPGAGAAAGATTGAIGGAIVGGPIGAVVGGAAGAMIGGLSAEQSQQVRGYVVQQNRPSVRIEERVVVGQPLPRNVELYEVPRSAVGTETEIRYGVVNDRTVLVDPRTRRVIQVVE